MGATAVVVGGSIAGQLAAAVLARRGFTVSILDRDALPDAAAPRRGVPQGRHLHALMVSGQRALEALLPGLTARLTASGAEMLTWTDDVAVHSLAGWHVRFPSDLCSCFMSRDLLDREVRLAVAAVPGILTLNEHEVTGLTGSAEAVRGVHCRRRGGGGGEGESVIDADLVVDASGRDSRAPEWLAALGIGAAGETTVDASLGYATRAFLRPSGLDSDWKAMLVRSSARPTRAGAVFPIEGGRWLVTLAGFAADYPPQDPAGFEAFVRSLGVPAFRAAVEAAEPLGPAAGYRRTTNRWRRYDTLARWPAGFVAIGDSVCAFNPFYGQGMAVAAHSARTLDASMARGWAEAGSSRAFQRRLASVLATPWLMATTEECRYPETVGAAHGWRTRLNLWFTDRLVARATHDPAAMAAFASVSQLVEPFSTLMRPRVLLPVLARPRARPAASPPRTVVRTAA